MEDIRILEAVEQYISGQMSPDERVYFEQLRKSNPEIDQLVVEHTLFLQQLARFEDTRQLKATLADTHSALAEQGHIQAPRLDRRAKVIQLYNRYKRTAAIAASIAGITALTMSALVWTLSPTKPKEQKDISLLDRRIDQVDRKTKVLEAKINQVQDNTAAVTPKIEYTSGGTGFLIDTKGYLVTNFHVIEKAQHVAVQSHNGKELKAKVVFQDPARDLAILKIEDEKYTAPSSIPYSIKSSSAKIAEPIFTLGYPRNDVVYGEGYLAAKTGFNGDTLSCQISITANRGNSGSPILNRNGEVIGILSAKQNTAEGAVFAIQSKYIYLALQELQKDTAYGRIRIPATSHLKGAERTQQVEKISDFVYMVKVD